MANFNLADYETVEERIKRFYVDHPNGRIITKNLTTLQDRQVLTWVVRAQVWIPNPIESEGWHEDYVLKASGHAFEVDGSGGANKTSALENAETSAIGRALANAGYSGNKRASREEMAKVERNQTPTAPLTNLFGQADALVVAGDLDGLRALYTKAERGGASTAILKGIKERADGLKQPQDPAS
jgi:hypothetical protein